MQEILDFLEKYWWAIAAGGPILADAVLGILPDKWVKYVGVLRRVVIAIKTAKMGMGTKICIIGLAVAIAGCSVIGIGLKESDFCAGVPEDDYSVICEIAESTDTTPEAISGVLKVANLSMLNKKYTAEQAAAFIDQLMIDIDMMQELKGKTYAEFIAYCIGRYRELPREVQAALVILDDFVMIDSSEIELSILSDYDYKGIRKHLVEQRAIVTIYLNP